MNYIINQSTLFLEFKNNELVIEELDRSYTDSINNIKKILEKSCIYYGSTLKGRIAGSKNYIKGRYKMPIIISEKYKLIFFYIKDNDNNIFWFNFALIKDYQHINKDVKIEFANGKFKMINISYTIFNNQMLKSSRLLVIYTSR